MNSSDPYLISQTSTRNRLARIAWGLAYWLLFRPSIRPMHAWRAMVLRCFGAAIGANTRIYPSCHIWAPWNLRCDDLATIAGNVNVYNPSPIHLASHAIVSEDAYLCGASHDMDDERFSMTSAPIFIGEYAWICARAAVLPGVRVGAGAVLALGSVATRDLAPWKVHAGIPARPIRDRKNPGGL
jgi:putative colanic acid biosynthesis acetyltransferase WcaF